MTGWAFSERSTLSAGVYLDGVLAVEATTGQPRPDVASLHQSSRAEIWPDVGPGGLYLVARLAREHEVQLRRRLAGLVESAWSAELSVYRA